MYVLYLVSMCINISVVFIILPHSSTHSICHLCLLLVSSSEIFCFAGVPMPMIGRSNGNTHWKKQLGFGENACPIRYMAAGFSEISNSFSSSLAMQTMPILNVAFRKSFSKIHWAAVPFFFPIFLPLLGPYLYPAGYIFTEHEQYLLV